MHSLLFIFLKSGLQESNDSDTWSLSTDTSVIHRYCVFRHTSVNCLWEFFLATYRSKFGISFVLPIGIIYWYIECVDSITPFCSINIEDLDIKHTAE